MSFGYIKYSGTPLAWPPTGRHSISRVSGAAGWGGRVILVFLKASCIVAIISFLHSFLDWKLFSFVLRAAIPHRYCTIKSHNGKSRYRQYKFQKSLQYEFVTSHWHLLRLHSRLHPCIQDASGQCDAVEQSAANRLPQFSKVRIPIEYGGRQGRRQRGWAVVPAPHLKSVRPISCLARRLLHTSNIVLKNVPLLVVFGPLAAKSWRRAWWSCFAVLD